MTINIFFTKKKMNFKLANVIIRSLNTLLHCVSVCSYVRRYMWSIFTMINLEFSTLGGKRKRPKKNLSSSVKRSWDCSRLRILQKNQESIKMQVYPYLKMKIVYFLGLPGSLIFLNCHFSVLLFFQNW